MNRQDAKKLNSWRSWRLGGSIDREKTMNEPDKRLDELAHAVIGAAIEVHRVPGPGYLENVYQKALAVELKLRGIPFVAQKQVSLNFKGENVGEGYLDFLVDEILVVELKTVEAIARPFTGPRSSPT
jgi:GxxExxY protein